MSMLKFGYSEERLQMGSLVGMKENLESHEDLAHTKQKRENIGMKIVIIWLTYALLTNSALRKARKRKNIYKNDLFRKPIKKNRGRS